MVQIKQKLYPGWKCSNLLATCFLFKRPSSNSKRVKINHNFKKLPTQIRLKKEAMDIKEVAYIQKWNGILA